MHIVKAERDNAELLATLVSKSNMDVADSFNLHINNAPKHPSFCTSEWIQADFDRGQEYFLVIANTTAQGCVAFEQPDANTVYLNRLSVLPEFRHKGIGTLLVKHILDYATSKNAITVSIGIIAEHTQLKNWYLTLGFIEGATQKFPHLPFDVLYMHYEI
jgi:GNAT superfamily N-acetyltransferase